MARDIWSFGRYSLRAVAEDRYDLSDDEYGEEFGREALVRLLEALELELERA